MSKNFSRVVVMLLLAVLLLNTGQGSTLRAAETISFPETGFSLSDEHGFLSYWRNNGGLPQFGYPTTAEIYETNPADGKTYIVQWFERNRFEWHPENKGTQYEVLLGLLGRQLTIGRENESVFRPQPDPKIAGQVYFAETGHTLRNSFKAYWERNGGLAMYGYPITEEFMEQNPSDGKTYVTQWFERARFEWHPEFLNTPYEVLLGLLGNQIVGPPFAPDPPAPTNTVRLSVPAKFAYEVFAPDKPRDFKMPPGFKISLFAYGTKDARFMTFAPNGDLFLSERYGGRVVVLPDRDKDGIADDRIVYAENLNTPHGLAFYGGYLYVAEETQISRYPYTPGDTKPSGARQVVVPNLPELASGVLTGHTTRTIIFGPNNKLYVSIGSSCDVCIESSPLRASIWQYNPDGSGGRLFAGGLRNAVGINFDPRTNLLWATVMGRNSLGDNFPPDLLTTIRDGGNYGWPYCVGIPAQPDPQFGAGRDEYCKQVDRPLIGLPAHIAPLGLAFYNAKLNGGKLPAIYDNGMFVAIHGSTERDTKYGYDVRFVSMRPGKLQAGPQPFISGWLVNNQFWGRPVDIVFGQDGAMYISDDVAGAVYRVTT